MAADGLAEAAAVADALRSPRTRDAALGALEALPPPIAADVALAAAPALADVVAAAGEESERAALDRAALLVARLLAEAAPDPAPVYGAAFGGERYAAYLAPRLVVEAAQRALGEGGAPLARADASSYACLHAYLAPACARGYTAPNLAAGRTELEMFGIVSSQQSSCQLVLASVCLSSLLVIRQPCPCLLCFCLAHSLGRGVVAV